jgi:hypothetical protein
MLWVDNLYLGTLRKKSFEKPPSKLSEPSSLSLAPTSLHLTSPTHLPSTSLPSSIPHHHHQNSHTHTTNQHVLRLPPPTLQLLRSQRHIPKRIMLGPAHDRDRTYGLSTHLFLFLFLSLSPSLLSPSTILHHLAPRPQPSPRGRNRRRRNARRSILPARHARVSRGPGARGEVLEGSTAVHGYAGCD